MLFAALDLLYLRWVWIHFENWGFWDWDYQQMLLEATRISWVEHFQIPLWNPYIRGGVTLAGNTLNHAFAPCLVPVLIFGTIAGVKLVIFAYLLIAQAGMYLLGRYHGLTRDCAFLAALIFSLGGIFAQRMTHGHFEWIAIAWIPFVLLMMHKGIDRPSLRTLGAGGIFLAFIFLDGGPYQFAFLAVFLGVYTLLLLLKKRSFLPMSVLFVIFLIGVGLASIKLFPVLETVSRYPRTPMKLNFYGAPTIPGAGELLYQAFLSRAQSHDPDAWMPYILNVGCYVGLLPILLAIVAIGARLKRLWFQVVLLLFFGWIMLGTVFSYTPWAVLSQLPGLSMLRVPSRFNLFVLLVLALLAAEGMQVLIRLISKQGSTNTKLRRLIPALLIAIIAADLIWVNGDVLQKAFLIPPVKVESRTAEKSDGSEELGTASSEFKYYAKSPYLDTYKATALYPTFPNWVGAAYPAMLENRGVMETYRTIHSEAFALPFTHENYKGEAVINGRQGEVLNLERTPNRITVHTNGKGNLLFINQNFDKDWECTAPEGATITEGNGLITVKLIPGQTEYVLVYRPGSFFLGAAVSLLTLFFMVASWFWLQLARKSVPVSTGGQG